MIDSTLNSLSQQTLSVPEWRRRYEGLGLETIPLIGKQPFDTISWKEVPSDLQWRNAGPNFKGNIGIIVGNGLVVIDADNHETAIAVDCGLKSVGLHPVIVRSPHGKHFYQKVDNIPEKFNYSLLVPEIYEGELRARNAYVVAPCSQVNGVPYRWENGSPESLLTQRVVEWKDLMWLLPSQEVTFQAFDQSPLRLLRRNMPLKARLLLEELQITVKGEPVEKYQSRSEAEAAVISMLILAGWTYDEIFNAFHQWMPGKFKETKGKDRQNYFDRTYHRVLSKIADHPARQEIADIWHAIHNNPFWPGNSGFLQRDALLGLLAICWQFASWQINASERDLAEYAAATRQGIHRTLIRLVEQEYIRRVSRKRELDKSTFWEILPLRIVPSSIMTYGNFSRAQTAEVAELWSQAMLGRTAGTIYYLLDQIPASVSGLARRAGKAWSTVWKALHKLENFHLATCTENQWIQGNGDLAEVAKKFETEKATRLRRTRHERERSEYLERLQISNQARRIRQESQ